jgi:hypothetical protein
VQEIPSPRRTGPAAACPTHFGGQACSVKNSCTRSPLSRTTGEGRREAAGVKAGEGWGASRCARLPTARPSSVSPLRVEPLSPACGRKEAHGCWIGPPLIKPPSAPWYDGSSLPHGGQWPLSVARERRGRAWEVRRRRPRHWAQKSAEVRGCAMTAHTRTPSAIRSGRERPSKAGADGKRLRGARHPRTLGVARRHFSAGHRLAPRPSIRATLHARRRDAPCGRERTLFDNPRTPMPAMVRDHSDSHP